ncbi:NAD(P)-binding domain-containing protein [Salipiger mucosus]|nr:NAD(P)-binding domain-containing protein [Salipiger mucosus]
MSVREGISLSGCGTMGQAIGGRLLACGHALTVFDPNAAHAEPLAAMGARMAGSSAEAASSARFHVLSLNSARIVEQAVFGPKGLCEGAREDFSPTGRIDNMVKDLSAVQDLARSTGTAMPLTGLCCEIHRLLVSAGLGPADNAALISFYDGPRN